MRFKVRLVDNPESPLKKPLNIPLKKYHKYPGLSKEDALKSYIENVKQIYEIKENMLKEMPTITLTVELFGTLDIVEHYLLNKMLGRDQFNLDAGRRDLEHQFKMVYREGGIPPNLPTKTQTLDDEEEEEYEEEDDDLNLNNTGIMRKDSANIEPKGDSGSKVGKQLSSGEKMNSSPQAIKKGISLESKIDSRSKDKKKSVNQLLGKDMNFKKYLECEFLLNGQPISKNTTISEISQKIKSTISQTSFSYGGDELLLEYRLGVKKSLYQGKDINLSAGEDEIIKSFCNDNGKILRSIISRIKTVGQSMKGVHLEQHTINLIQMFIFLNEINKSYINLTSNSSSFLSEISELKKSSSLKSLFESQTLTQLRPSFFPAELLSNKKISQILAKRFISPQAIVSKSQLQPLYRIMASFMPFVVELSTRMLFFKHIVSSVPRSLYYLYQTFKNKLKELESSKVGKILRLKVKVPRDKLLENAIIYFENYGSKNSMLEFEFQDEEGSGLGPTLEYYALLSHEIRDPKNKLWRRTDGETLFPTPLDPFLLKPDGAFKKRGESKGEISRELYNTLNIYKTIGTVIARAIIDERLIDLPLNSVFWDLVLDRSVSFHNISGVDRALGEIVSGLKEVVNRRREILADTSLAQDEKDNMISRLNYKGSLIENLGFTFTLPGFDDVPLIENGLNINVTIDNLEDYLERFCKVYLVESVKLQVLMFREGFSRVMPLDSLKCLESQEIEYLYCGCNNEKWEIKDLHENVVASHGYTNKSASFLNFLTILTELSSEERRIFLQFVTGSPRLPLGGFKSLNPRLTVVRKEPSYFNKYNDELPSVMTCQNYIKLPDYTSIEIMKEKLFYAMKEGQKEFTLS